MNGIALLNAIKKQTKGEKFRFRQPNYTNIGTMF